ncbi:unnamed protein product [Cylicocyclus nassatus]|uniref:Uncharacterized protein n=1 Tax=Cylicocyclus nassatus TaxID=53992 RepID=A0AA36H013_CYLNA|nr:unnamed protein product [Cylicocyclus nassatus]
MPSYICLLIALFVTIRFSLQEEMQEDNFTRPRRNFFMSSGPSRARVMEMERLVNSIFPRRTRSGEPIVIDDTVDAQEDGVPSHSLVQAKLPCFCPPFSPCIGNCYRTYNRYW